MAFVGDVSIDNKKNQQMRVILLHTHTHSTKALKNRNKNMETIEIYRWMNWDDEGRVLEAVVIGGSDCMGWLTLVWCH